MARGDGRASESSFEVTVAEGNAVAWPRFAQEKISLVADRAGYRVGDTAKLVVQTPFERAKGLDAITRTGIPRDTGAPGGDPLRAVEPCGRGIAGRDRPPHTKGW